MSSKVFFGEILGVLGISLKIRNEGSICYNSAHFLITHYVVLTECSVNVEFGFMEHPLPHIHAHRISAMCIGSCRESCNIASTG